MFAGTPEFAARHLAALLDSRHQVAAVITQPDKPGKRGKKPQPGPVKLLAQKHELTVLQPERLRPEDIESWDVDLMVVVAYGQLLRPPVLDALPKGCINVHASLLPRWRGAAPIQRAILAGDTSTGVCIMQMDAGLDTGDVLHRSSISIAADDTAASLTDKLAEIGCSSLVTTLDQIEAGIATKTQQPDEGVTYAKKITKDEARLNWQAPAPALDHAVRAYNPDPVAYAFIGELRVKIWHAHAATTAHQGRPGEILALDKHGLEIACGEGSLIVTRIQLPLGKGSILTPADLINAGRKEFIVGNQFNA